MKKVLLLLSILAIMSSCVTLPQDSDRTISSSGTALLKVSPDEAHVIVAVETLEKTAELSKNKNAQISDAIYAALYKLNIPRDSIETDYFNIYEEFEWHPVRGQESKGFKTAHTIRITTTHFDNVGPIVDAAVDAGATRIQSIDFDISEAKKSSIKKQALADASKDAREKAEAIASGLGAELGDVVSVSDSSYDYMPYPMMSAAMDATVAKEEIARTTISPKQLEVSATVQVVYEIED